MQIKSILEHHFDITDATVTKMEGYDSINYRVESTKGTYVLKENSYSDETLALL